MRIESLEYEELHSGWRLNETTFDAGVTLLVGISGAGKTRILTAIRNICSIASSNSIEPSHPIRFKLVFSLSDGARYTWHGETLDAGEDCVMFEEYLVVDGVEIFSRKRGLLSFRGKEMPSLSADMSGLRIFAQDENIAHAIRGFENTILINHGKPPQWKAINISKAEFEGYKQKFPTIEELRNSDLPLQLRVNISSYVAKKEFKEITSRFMDVFRNIKHVSFFTLAGGEQWLSYLMATEKDVKMPIGFDELSSGMLNMFQLIASCYLWPEDTLVLIDEFESSMGMNCLDDATDLVLETGRRMQFILTSHHPYVINNIRPEHWKIVTRNGSVVSTHDAGEVGIGTSHHTAFTQLMNTPEYAQGIMSE